MRILKSFRSFVGFFVAIFLGSSLEQFKLIVVITTRHGESFFFLLSCSWELFFKQINVFYLLLYELQWLETIISTALRKKSGEERQLISSKFGPSDSQALVCFSLCTGAFSDPAVTSRIHYFFLYIYSLCCDG